VGENPSLITRHPSHMVPIRQGTLNDFLLHSQTRDTAGTQQLN